MKSKRLLGKCACCQSTSFKFVYYGNHNYRVKRLIYLLLAKYFNYIIFLKPVQYFIKKSNRSLRERIYTKTIFSYSKIKICNDCGHGDEVGEFSTEKIELYYKDAYGSGAHLPEEKYKDASLYLNNSRAIGFNNLSSGILKGKELSLVEVGGGPCFISRNLRHHYPNLKISNIEPGSPWYKYFEMNNIDLISKSFPHDDLGTFDVVISSHSLEHFRDLTLAAKSLCSLVNETGVLLIEVPNCSDEYFKQDLVDTPHLQFFTRKSLVSLLEKYGLKPLIINEIGFSLEKAAEGSQGLLTKNDHVNLKDSVENNIQITNGIYLRGAFVRV